ncbi:alpha/beta hydrolase [Granulicella cerasi]|uniref:Alpha/beta hydrolase n=1 Tax=Granulicella cerasi TaxID=741063 RepID=A0ABW1ZA34_9BACT|nr:alpha/beta hydrolase-fold protein [Granulicella cerasi]
MNRTLLAAALALVSPLAFAQSAAPTKAVLPPPPSLLGRSAEVHADRTVTFRVAAPTAQDVKLSMDTLSQPLAMTRDENGVWSVTTAALAPEIYDYVFIVDGVRQPDPAQWRVHNSFVGLESLVQVPGTPAMPWELTDVPHGEVTVHHFTTHATVNQFANQSEYLVYTPAGYDAKKKGGYPVLYLLHGYLDDATAWTQVARAHFVLDSMIASGKAVPMIVVMPQGYGDYKFLTGGFGQWSQPALVNNNVDHFIASMETEVIPAVEREYNVAKDRNHRAVSGLSMGGLETIELGLSHPEQFAYVAAMSAAVHNEGFDARFPKADGKAANFKLLWTSVGTDDHLLQPNRDFVKWAQGKGYTVEAHETKGAHQWPVWRENLVTILPLLFK